MVVLPVRPGHITVLRSEAQGVPTIVRLRDDIPRHDRPDTNPNLLIAVDLNLLLIQCTIDRKVNYDLSPTLAGRLYGYAFGDKPDEITLRGIAGQYHCNYGTEAQNQIEGITHILDLYHRYRPVPEDNETLPRKTLLLQLGTNHQFRVVIRDLHVDLSASYNGYWEWRMSLYGVPWF